MPPFLCVAYDTVRFSSNISVGLAPPVIHNLTPGSGSVAGGYDVEIFGEHFSRPGMPVIPAVALQVIASYTQAGTGSAGLLRCVAVC